MAQIGRGVFEDHRTIVGKTEETEEVLFRVLKEAADVWELSETYIKEVATETWRLAQSSE